MGCPYQHRVAVEDRENALHGVRGMSVGERNHRGGGAQSEAASNRSDFVVNGGRRGGAGRDGNRSRAPRLGFPRQLGAGQLGESGRGGCEGAGHRCGMENEEHRGRATAAVMCRLRLTTTFI